MVPDDGARATGYAHEAFARVYEDFGDVRRLEACGGFVLERAVGESGLRDAMGCYPAFCCRDWSGLPSDFERCRDIVSLVLVSDPFAPCTEASLRSLFERVHPFKLHYVVDLERPLGSWLSKERRRKAERCLRRVDVSVISTALDQHVDEWMTLQSSLAEKHDLSPMARLTRTAVERLFKVPGLVLFRAAHEGSVVGMHVEFRQGAFVYGHFAAYSPLGYALGVSAAMHLYEIMHFQRGDAGWIDWGGVPGVEQRSETGLDHFKRAFSTGARMAHLCGKIFDEGAYALLAKDGANYFPAYRAGEFA